MKGRVLLAFSFILVLSMFFSTFGAAQAAPLQSDPVVTVISGAAGLKTTVIALENLPGSYVGSEGLTLPVNSPTGDMQFGGDGVQVSGLEGGSANACFATKPPAEGWSGKVYSFNGSKWVSVESTTTENEEGLFAKTCATIYHDGTYALIISYAPPANKALSECVNILSIGPDIDWNFGSDEIFVIGGWAYPGIAVGSHVRYQLLNIEPEGSITGDLSASGVVVENVVVGPGPEDFYSYVEFPEGTTLTSTVDWWDENSFTVRFFFQNCYKDFQWPQEFS
jgi:hypothetical protein